VRGSGSAVFGPEEGRERGIEEAIVKIRGHVSQVGQHVVSARGLEAASPALLI
jgi:hypothetical protein